MGSSLRRQLREVLPAEVKGLPRAVALEIADDARWDDGWRYNPEAGRRSKATLSDLVRWTAAKNERVIGDALRTLALAGWEFRVPFGKGKDGRPLYAVPGRAVEFRVPDFEAPAGVGSAESEGPVTTDPSEKGPAVADPSTPEGPVTTAKGPAVAAEGPVTTGAGPVTTGPPSHVPSYSHKDSPSTTSPAEASPADPPVAPEVPDGGGGGSDLRSLAIHIADSLDYRGKPPGKRLRQTIEDRLTAALAAGWSVNGLAVVLDIEGQDVDYPAAVYAHRLDPAELPPTEPVSAPQPFRGGVRGDVLTAAEVEALELEDVLSTTRRDTADGGMWERAMARARGGTDDRVAGWGAVARELARREHQPYSNPQDDSIYDEPWTVPPPRPSWCGEPECEPIGRMREHVDANGLKRDVPCPRCHPDRVRAA